MYAAALFTGTHLPNPAGMLPIETNDKWWHFGAYFGLAFLLATVRSHRAPVTWRTLLATGSLVAVIGMADEVTQAIPALHRTADVFDWLADISGAAIGLVMWHGLRRTQPSWFTSD